jgi:hypothetical protein
VDADGDVASAFPVPPVNEPRLEASDLDLDRALDIAGCPVAKARTRSDSRRSAGLASGPRKK